MSRSVSSFASYWMMPLFNPLIWACLASFQAASSVSSSANERSSQSAGTASLNILIPAVFRVGVDFSAAADRGGASGSGAGLCLATGRLVFTRRCLGVGPQS